MSTSDWVCWRYVYAQGEFIRKNICFRISWKFCFAHKCYQRFASNCWLISQCGPNIWRKLGLSRTRPPEKQARKQARNHPHTTTRWYVVIIYGLLKEIKRRGILDHHLLDLVLLCNILISSNNISYHFHISICFFVIDSSLLNKAHYSSLQSSLVFFLTSSSHLSMLYSIPCYTLSHLMT